MKTQDIKNYLSMLMTTRGEWKRKRKYKDDGDVMRDFENTLKYDGCTFTVNTGPEDGRVHSILITMPEPPEVEKKPAQPATAKELAKGYFYKLYEPSNEPDWIDFEYPVTHVLTIGRKQRYMDDGPYAAQKALDPMMQKAIGKRPHEIELMEGTFELLDGEAAKLEPLLIAAGWQQGGW